MNTNTNFSSRFLNTAPPGVKTKSLSKKVDIDESAVEQKFSESAPQTDGFSLTQKLVTGAMAGLAGLAAFTPNANAAPAETLVTQSLNQSDGLEVTVVAPDTPRVDLLRKGRVVSRGRSGRKQVSKTPHSEVGVHLGRGVFHDANGNLSLVPSLAADWGDNVTDFKRVELDVPGFDESVTQYGNTIHHEESPFSRNVYAQFDHNTKLHRDGEQSNYEVLNDGVQFRGEDGVEWRVTQEGNVVNIDGPGAQDFQLTYGSQKHFDNVKVKGPKRDNAVYFNSKVIEIEGTGGDKTVVRSEDGKDTKIEAGLFQNYSVKHDGNQMTVEGLIFDSQVTTNPSEFMQNQEINFGQLTRALEQAEPGYTAKHPLVMTVLEYATANPGLMGEDADSSDVFGLGKAVTGAGALYKTGKAFMNGAKALELGETAMGLGQRALEMKAAAQAAASGAQAAAQAGNLAEAASLASSAKDLAGNAQALGGQAQSLGSKAHGIGDSALKTAHTAKILTGVSGGLEMVEGAIELGKGASELSTVEGAKLIADAMLEQLSQEKTGSELEQAQKDHADVMRVLNQLEENSDKTMTVGGMKIGCGGLMVISALAGGAVIPPIIGAVGAICTVGTTAYEHWDDITGFFTGDEVKEPSLQELLPTSNTVEESAQ